MNTNTQNLGFRWFACVLLLATAGTSGAFAQASATGGPKDLGVQGHIDIPEIGFGPLGWISLLGDTSAGPIGFDEYEPVKIILFGPIEEPGNSSDPFGISPAPADLDLFPPAGPTLLGQFSPASIQVDWVGSISAPVVTQPGFAVPAPGSIGLVLVAAGAASRRRRR